MEWFGSEDEDDGDDDDEDEDDDDEEEDMDTDWDRFSIAVSPLFRHLIFLFCFFNTKFILQFNFFFGQPYH